jgi:hypothetical protein
VSASLPASSALLLAPICKGPSPFQSVDCHVRMADPPEAAPVVEQPSAQAEVPDVPMEEVGEVAAGAPGA